MPRVSHGPGGTADKTTTAISCCHLVPSQAESDVRLDRDPPRPWVHVLGILSLPWIYRVRKPPVSSPDSLKGLVGIHSDPSSADLGPSLLRVKKTTVGGAGILKFGTCVRGPSRAWPVPHGGVLVFFLRMNWFISKTLKC